MNKQEMRRQYKSIRNAMSMNEITYKSERIQDSLIKDDIIQKAENIFIYLSFSSEVQTHNLILMLLSEGKKVYVPFCDIQNCTMKPCRICSLDDLTKNAYGIEEPIKHKLDFVIFDVAILPGIAFDIQGNRIGYGKGYYDKFIAELNYPIDLIGICFDGQLAKSIPVQKHDIKMNRVITDKQILYF